MEVTFEESRFLSRKWLLSMVVGEERQLPESKVAYKNLKTTCCHLRRLDKGVWRVSKKGLDGYTRVVRIK